jgi:FkbM family methyltransferase
MEKLGTNYGGWYVPTHMNLNKSSVIYSGGVGEDMSFDIKLQSKYNCNIYLIDPTTKAIKHFEEIREYYKDNDKKVITGNIQPDYFYNIENETPNFEKINYIDYGLWNENTELKFYKQENDNYVSQSIINGMFSNNFDIIKTKTIKTIMDENNHRHIDLLKLDIEGAENKVLEKMFEDNIYPNYILIEFDLLLKKKDFDNSTKRIIHNMITKHNYKILKNDNLNITFSRI